jgi:hypothetical protein
MLLSKRRGTILIFGVQRCNHTLYIGHQIQIIMCPSILRLIHERLVGFVGELSSWGHWQLDQLSNIRKWKFGDFVDLVVPFDQKCARNIQGFVDPDILLELIGHLIL